MKCILVSLCILAAARGAVPAITGLSSTTFPIVESHESSAFNLVTKLQPTQQYDDTRSRLLFSIDTSFAVGGSVQRKMLTATEKEALEKTIEDEEKMALENILEKVTATEKEALKKTIKDEEEETLGKVENILENKDKETSQSAKVENKTSNTVVEEEIYWGHQVEVEKNDVTTTEDEKYKSILRLNDKAFAHQCYVAVAQDSSTSHIFPVVFCDFLVPTGLNVTAEIRDDKSCDEFTDESESNYYTKGVASATLIPTVTDDEKRQGIFDHSYCARLDIHYNGKSVVERRFLMDITYHYNIDKKTGEIQEQFSAELHDENSAAKKDQQAVAVGLGVFAGVIVTLALIAIIFGKKKKSRRREIEQGRQRFGEGQDVEMEILNAFEMDDSPEEEGDRDTDATVADSAVVAAVNKTGMDEEQVVAKEENEIV